MKKFLLFLLLSSPLLAASKAFHDLPSQLQMKATYASTFTHGEDEEVAESDLGVNQDEAEKDSYCFGLRVNRKSWVTDFDKKAHVTDSFTISFDALEIEGENDQTLLSIYTPGCKWDNALRLIIGKKNNLELRCKNFADSTIFGKKSRRNICPLAEIRGKTITITYNGGKNTVCVYCNGQKVGKSMRLTYKPGVTPRKIIKELTWSETLGGGSKIEYFCIDNLYFWPQALSEKEVAEIIQPEYRYLWWVIGGSCGAVFLLGGCIFLRRKKSIPQAQ